MLGWKAVANVPFKVVAVNVVAVIVFILVILRNESTTNALDAEHTPRETPAV